MKKSLIISIVLSVSIFTLYSQNKTIKGGVIDESLETWPCVSIMINDTVKVGETNVDGFFQVEIPDSVKIITFIYIGFEPKTIELVGQCDEVVVIMMSDAIYDFMTLKKINRLRKKRFKELPPIHKEAFLKGIFKTEKACYKQEFIAYLRNP